MLKEDSNLSYEKELYPLQNMALEAIDLLKFPFYLTGGTALSRCYYNHRYSDDLDLFVNDIPDFVDLAERCLSTLSPHTSEILSRGKSFYSIVLEDKLKIDFVNDVSYHYGEFNTFPIFSKVDNALNILSNKISALIGRDDPKDVVDIWVIAKNAKIDWKKIFKNVSSKAAGIYPLLVAEKLDTFPIELLETIKWRIDSKPVSSTLSSEIQKIISEITSL